MPSLKPLQTITVRDFSGGLNLANAPYNLSENELVEACDVNLDAAGGFCSRGVLSPFTTNPLASPVCTTWHFEQALSGDSYVFMHLEDGTVWYVLNGPGPAVQWTPSGPSILSPPGTGRCCYVSWQAHGLMYISNGNKVFRWDSGANAVTDVTATSTSDLYAIGYVGPPQNLQKVPPGCAVSVFGSRVFIADSQLSGPLTGGNQVYWSIPLLEYPTLGFVGQETFANDQLESFGLGDDADVIVSIVPCGKNLYVFKRHSTHVITPNPDPQTKEFFSADILSNEGTVGPKAVACESGVAFFFDSEKGVLALAPDGSMDWIFEPLYPLITEGQINPLAMREIAMGVCHKRLYVSVPMGTATKNTDTFVYDFKVGGWTRHKYGIDCFLDWKPTLRKSGCIGVVSSPCATLALLDTIGTEDEPCTGEVSKPEPKVCTRWFDDGLPYLEKGWKRPEFEVTSSDEVTGSTHGTFGWDKCNSSDIAGFTAKKRIATAPVVTKKIICPGEPPVPVPLKGSCNPEDPRTTKVKGSAMGEGRSLQIVFEGVESTEPWCINQLTMFYVAKDVRTC